MVESYEPDAKLPFGNVTNVQTPSVCPINEKTNNPVLGFHILMVES